MRSAGNFSPEWGYLAPAPSFARTARVVLVATAIGATAGAGVVLSLMDRSGEPEKTPPAARAIVTSVRTDAARAASRASVQNQPGLPLANRAAPAAPAAAASASANASPPNAPLPDVTAPAPTTAPAAATPTAGVGTAAVAAPAAATAVSPATPSVTATALPEAADSKAVVAPEPAAPPKKAKHHASTRPAPFAGIGSFFRRAFASHGGRSYYPQ
jgi:hypothetical protein